MKPSAYLALTFSPSLFLVFEEPEDPSARSFFSEIISSVSDVKFSHSGRYLLTRDYLTAKVWDLNMESKPLETYQVCDPSHGTIMNTFFLFCSICVANTRTHTRNLTHLLSSSSSLSSTVLKMIQNDTVDTQCACLLNKQAPRGVTADMLPCMMLFLGC